MNAERTRLGIGLAVSCLVNSLLIVPGLTADTGSNDDDSLLGDEVQPPDFMPEPPEDEVTLGIEESEASTLTWIGYEQYREHMAKLSELEQAQFVAGGAADGGGGNPAPTSTPSQQPTTTPTEPQPEEDTPEPRPEQAPLPQAPDATMPVPSETDKQGEAEKPSETPSDVPSPQKPAQKPTPQQPPQPPAPKGGDNAPTPGPPKPQAGPSATGAEDLPPVPNASDRDSDATAIHPVNVKRPGGPVAAQGLEVRTFRPKLTPYEELQFGRISIVAKLEFDRLGKPKRISLGTPDPRSKTMRWQPANSMSGYLGKVITSLYRWRASGKDLKGLTGDETIPIVFELTFK